MSGRDRGLGLEEVRRVTFETRTELETILGLADLLAEEHDPSTAEYGDLARIRRSAANIGRLIEQLEGQFDRTHQAASRDPLTGLLNRRALAGEAEDSLERDGPVSLVLLDLDGFKAVNDTHGHLVGDELLREVARRCVAAVRGSDVVARLAGDEFVLLLPDTPVTEATRVAERVREAIRDAPVDTTAGRLSMTASLGVSARPVSGCTVRDLLGRADAALYVAKRSGRDRVSVEA